MKIVKAMIMMLPLKNLMFNQKKEKIIFKVLEITTMGIIVLDLLKQWNALKLTIKKMK